MSLKMEDCESGNHKVSDSGYSNSTNSQSQSGRGSSGSSKSHHSNSSGSSGYEDLSPTLTSTNEVFPRPPISKRHRDYRRKKSKSAAGSKKELERESKNSPAPGIESTTGNDGNKVSVMANGKAAGKIVEKGSSFARPVVLHHEIVAALEALPCKDGEAALLEDTDIPDCVTGDASEQEQSVNCIRSIEDLPSHIETEFSTVVSLHDCMVMYATSSMASLLGFPKDMWLGRSFIDLVHPKDRMAFASHISIGMAGPLEHNQMKVTLAPKESFYCCLRQYKGLQSKGFGITEKIAYFPFHLHMTFREVLSTEKLGLAGENPGVEGKFLIIIATLIKSSYTSPDETKMSSKFLTKHQASSYLSQVDPEAIPYLGYFPRDMLGRSVFEFYHPEDLPFLNKVYETVMKAQGQSIRSKPYRFQTQNGGYVLLETEWSAFINPWSRKVEFIIGQHSVLKGPPNPDVFACHSAEETYCTSEEVLKESKMIQQEIICLLKETVHRQTGNLNSVLPKQCREVASFMECLMEQVKKPELKAECIEDQSFSNNIFSQEQDSVMLVAISPHHDDSDGKSSSEIPPSYYQLNYNENIQRFFESKPKTTLSNGELKRNANRSHCRTDEEGKNMAVTGSSLDSSNRKCCCPSNGSGSGSGDSARSAGMPAGDVAGRGDTSVTHTSNRSYQSPHLTEALLFRHNEDMEKQMFQKHREQRTKGEGREGKKRHSHDKQQDVAQGVKRSSSRSWEGEPYKASKHSHKYNILHPVGHAVPLLYQRSYNMNLWPPFSPTVSPHQGSQPCSGHSNFPNAMGTMRTMQSPHIANTIPMYYIATGAQQAGLQGQGLCPQEQPRPPSLLMPGQPPFMGPRVPFVHPLPGMMYHPVQPLYGATPMMYPSLMLQPSAALPASMMQAVNHASNSLMKHDIPHPETMSERSSGGHAPVEGPNEVRGNKAMAMAMEMEIMTTGEDSNSSYYSFLRTDKSDESLKSSPPNKETSFPCKQDPPWLEQVTVTPDLLYRYQIDEKSPDTILEKDLQLLKKIQQPLLVNEQLNRLYMELELEGLSTELKLDEHTSSSGSSGSSCEEAQGCTQNQRKRRSANYSRLVVLFEENAPLPPPASH